MPDPAERLAQRASNEESPTLPLTPFARMERALQEATAGRRTLPIPEVDMAGQFVRVGGACDIARKSAGLARGAPQTEEISPLAEFAPLRRAAILLLCRDIAPLQGYCAPPAVEGRVTRRRRGLMRPILYLCPNHGPRRRATLGGGGVMEMRSRVVRRDRV